MEARLRKNRTILLMNNKGGVGKTTNAFYLAKQYQRNGRSVTCIDFDQQGQLATLLPEITRSDVDAEDIPEIASDYVIIDTSPQFSHDHVELMDVSDMIIVPFTLESLEINQTLKLIRTIKKTGNAHKCNIVVFHGGTNTILYKNLMPVVENLASELGVDILATIRKSQSVPQGIMEGKTVFEIQSPPDVRSAYKAYLRSVSAKLVELVPKSELYMKPVASKGEESWVRS